MSAAITVTGTVYCWTMSKNVFVFRAFPIRCCRWFKVAVLPLDAALYAEISKSRDEVKRCAVCGAVFTPKSNRAKYCPDCAVRMRRKKEAERQRKRYLLSTHLGR